jgi:hypothetical protein
MAYGNPEDAKKECTYEHSGGKREEKF